ncbi:hypothetical protein Tco_0928639 [Tanacetum coccineum]
MACLERTDGNAEFHQIVDFLITSPIHYALTISPTIYASYIEQFWATAMSKIVNDVKQIHAIVDGKTVVISESLVRSDLHFNDEDGITYLSNDEIFIALAEPFNDVYVTPVHAKKVFTNIKRQNKDFSGTVTPLFASMLVPQVVEGEGSGQLSEPQPPSSTAPPSHKEQVTIVASQSHKTHTLRRAKRGQDTEIPQSSGPPKKVGNEAVYTGEDDRVVRAATTATSLEAEQESEVNTFGSGEDNMEHQDDLTNFVPPTPHDSPLSGGHTPGSDEGRPNINELMAICTKLSNRILSLETSKTAQDLVIKKLKKKGKRLEKKQRARTPWMKLFKIDTSKRKSSRSMFEEGDFDDDFDDINDIENEEMENVEGDTVNAASASVTIVGVSISTAEQKLTPPTTTTTVYEDEDLTIAQTLVNIRSEKAKEKGIAFRDVEESARSIKILPTINPKDKGKGIMQEPEKPPKNLRKAQIQMDEELAMRLHEEEKDELKKCKEKELHMKKHLMLL